MRKILPKIGWILSYFQILVIVPFGTCTQGDDDPWTASLIYSILPLLGLIIILVSNKENRESTSMGLPHIITLIAILWNTPSFWIRCTFQGQHICAGFDKDLINAFGPELWHRFWAPVVTIMGLAFVVLGFRYFKNDKQEYQTKVSTKMQK
ncbi:membrane protein [Candidatus Magnetomorum sp. HK-1]|nr:membrane protein [Candidatus Magnetomorum sp. HK-1]